MSDPFEQIGPKLKAARESAGLDLAEAASNAQIPTTAAKALEEENFSDFASPVYAKSFLTKYSESLGVDARQWLDALEPGSFMPNGALLKGPETAPQRDESAPEQRGGVLAVLIILLVTAALIIAAIKGYEYFEDRFSDTPREKPVTE